MCRFISNPGRQHWTAAQRVLRYLSGTSSLGIQFSKQELGADDLIGFSDADWAGDLDTRQSTTGFIFMMSGGPISWKSKLQQSTSLSSVEAEYFALCSASREAKWMKEILKKLGFGGDTQITIHEDNQGCISISGNRRTDSRTKHIDVKYHFVREMITKGIVAVKYRRTEEMLEDIFTKPTAAAKFKQFTKEFTKSPSSTLRGPVGNQTPPHDFTVAQVLTAEEQAAGQSHVEGAASPCGGFWRALT